MVIEFDRALTDKEWTEIEEVCRGLMTLEYGREAAAVYQIPTAGRQNWAVIQDIVKADSENKTFPRITVDYPAWARTYLSTKGWEIGCGFVLKVGDAYDC